MESLWLSNTFIFAIIATFVPNIISINYSKQDCINLDISITQKIENLGFHRDLYWLIETENLDPEVWRGASCDVAFRFDVGQAMFVNPDQIEDLKRLGKLDVMINGTVDVEAPAHEGTKHSVYIFLNSTQLPYKISVKLPIHLRYQRSLMGGHGKVVLNKPLLLVNCQSAGSIMCEEDETITAPLSSSDFGTLGTWRNITYKADFSERELLVPVGNLDDYPYVAVISCVLGCAGCIYLLSLTSRRSDDQVLSS